MKHVLETEGACSIRGSTMQHIVLGASQTANNMSK